MDRSQNRKHLIIVSVLIAIATVTVIILFENIQMFQPAASAQAASVDSLFRVQMWVIGFLFALIIVFMLYSIVVFRRRDGDDGDGAYIHGNTKLEIVWTVIPLITVLVFAFFSARALAKVTGEAPNELEVDVIAQQFSWRFNYPELGIENSPVLMLPKDRPVVLHLTSIDVIHDFWVPEFRVKQDAVPGLISDLRIRPTKVGTFKVRCDELCGILHHAMLADIQVTEPSDFDSWTSEQIAEIEAANAMAATGGEAVVRGKDIAENALPNCVGCHNVTGESTGIGPSWKGLFGMERQFADGTSMMADENYLRKSILEPGLQVVDTCPLGPCIPGVMPQTYGESLSEQDINDLIEYIKSLAE
ncbi:MAG: cytochrome c oxidase subunit II [Chloroflexota bacterium]|nr:cytochrome c oxidase subunit II [Chloroflexota bacterium]